MKKKTKLLIIGIVILILLIIGIMILILSQHEKESVQKRVVKNYKDTQVITCIKEKNAANVEETEDTLLDENNRILHQVTVEDVNAADKLFEDLMGTAIGPRKAYIKAHSKEATDNVE